MSTSTVHANRAISISAGATDGTSTGYAASGFDDGTTAGAVPASPAHDLR